MSEAVSAATADEAADLVLEAIARGDRLDLAGADLRAIDLRPGRAARGRGGAGPDVVPAAVRLDGANLSGAVLTGACLAGVSLRGAALDGALLVGADLRGADLSGAVLRNAHMTGADLRRADLSFADARAASLLTANLRDTVLIGVDLRDAVLHSANLTRAVLRSADLRWSRLAGANLAGATLDGASFEGAILSLARFDGARLSDTTAFDYAFLHQSRFDRTGLTRRNLGAGIGEALTDLALARDTFRVLARTFDESGRAADARWAHLQAARMNTATHRPDRARRYYQDRHRQPVRWRTPARLPVLTRYPGLTPTPRFRDAAADVRRASGRGWRRLIAPLLFHVRHGAAWSLGKLADIFTGHGTCYVRLVLAIAATWLLFAGYYAQANAVIHVDGAPGGWLDSMRYSAAALTPIDAYPLVATSHGVRALALVEGVVGMVLLGALGYVAASRIRRE